MNSVRGIVTAAAVLIQPLHAWAAGALAIGLPEGGAKNGIAMFAHVNAPTVDEAKTIALKGCRELPNASKAAKDQCKIFETFSDKCVAEAIDPQEGTPGWGYAIGETDQKASERALEACRKNAPKREGSCTLISDKPREASGAASVPLTVSWCDGAARAQ